MRDSAGVTIVENSAALWSKKTAWHLTPQPLAEIGEADGDPDYQLFQVTGATRLGNGRIVIANGGTRELRFYDPYGRYISAVGGKGGGPGEFESLMLAGTLPGDSLVAFDFNARRVSIFDAEGHFARAILLPDLSASGMAIPLVRGIFNDGSLLISGFLLAGADGVKTGVSRAQMPYLRLSADGASLDTLGTFPGSENYTLAQDRNFSVMSLPFGRNPAARANGEHFYYGAGDSYEIEIYSLTGTLERIIRRDKKNAPVTPRDIERYKADQLATVKGADERKRAEQRLADIPFPTTFAAHNEIRVDPLGNVWVADIFHAGDSQRSWTVFDTTGRMLGAVDMPARLAVGEIGADYLLGIWKDDSDIEYLRLYGLTKPKE